MSTAAGNGGRHSDEWRLRADELAGELAHARQASAADRTLIAEMRTQAQHDAATISSLQAASRRFDESVTWQLFQRLRDPLFAAIGGEHSVPVHALQSMVRLVGRMLITDRQSVPRTSPPRAAEPIEFPRFGRPSVSIVIPVRAQAELTRSCLESIRANTTGISYEVILVDDCADRETKALLSHVRGARIHVNTANLGYLRSVNLGASIAAGRWLLLGNNDIQVHLDWLAWMLDCALSRPDIAIVTPKYLQPDGRLSEAGGVIWRDGTGANYGRGDEPRRTRYEYRREVDYGSAASLMVRADFWDDVGGFDERYLPMYYEDTDLCFEARERGLRVMFEPRANVTHVEGATASSHPSTGHKRYQELNRPKFAEKWRARLEAEHLPPNPASARSAANRYRDPHVLVIDHRVPRWDRDSGSLRMRGMLEALVELGCRVTLLPDDGVAWQPYTEELLALGVEVLCGEPSDARGELSELGPGIALAILSRPHAASRWLDAVRACAPSARVVYDTVDLHWLRLARRDARERSALAGSLELGPQAVALREIELALIRATDVTMVVSEEERAHVQADVPGAETLVLPNTHELRVRVPPAQTRTGVLFVGGFEHGPNVDGALILVRDVMPLVWRELGDVLVTIVGDSVPPEVQSLASPLVDVAGWVADLDPLIDSARALVAPLVYGAGVKGKVTQSLAAGLPVVTTPIGAEGLDAVDGEHLLIGEDAQAIAGHTIRVLRDPSLWTRLSRSGQELAAARCSPSVARERIGGLVRLCARPGSPTCTHPLPWQRPPVREQTVDPL